MLILLLLFIPLYIAAFLFFKNVRAKSKEDREKMKLGVILAMITVTLVTIWACVYICRIYKYDKVYHGMGEAEDYWNYTYENKRSYVLGEVIMATVSLILLSYFWFATNTWANIAEE